MISDASGNQRISWEDPHPGERFTIPFGSHFGLGIHHQTSNRETMGGVAAKARSANENGTWVTRHSVRVRHRNTMPKPLKIPANVPEEPEAKSAPAVSARCFDSTPTLPLDLLRLPEPFPPLDMDMDIDTEVCTETITLDGATKIEPPSKAVNLGKACLTDFSNFLGITHIADDDGTSVTVVDPEAFTRVGSEDDLYGWEAELNRKMSCTEAETPCDYHHYHLPRVDSGKRGLLHRVFSTTGRRTSPGL
ncbi:hypothetical protein F5Y15DRAFT_178628 [Xylariaceae sp. FL0016]|nr:hypothetical protein F5Y15DRAFT_178628 [Xylariaceae sp. FL0016]